MSESIKKILSLLTKTKESAKSASIEDLLKEIQELKALVVTSLIQQQLAQVSEIIKDMKVPVLAKPTEVLDKPTPQPTPQPSLPAKEACDELAKLVTTKQDGAVRMYLLHRLTEDFEYENSIDGNTFKTDKMTDWMLNSDFADMNQDISGAMNPHKGVNPLVSCWIPEPNIDSIPGLSANTGVWGELGSDQKSNRYIVKVKPGKFVVYSELKQ